MESTALELWRDALPSTLPKDRESLLAYCVGFEDAVSHVLSADETCIVMIDDHAQRLDYLTCSGSYELSETNGGILFECAYTHKPYIATHARRHSAYRQIIDNPKNLPAESILVVPIVQGDKLIAIVRILSTHKDHAFALEESEPIIAVGQALCDLISAYRISIDTPKPQRSKSQAPQTSTRPKRSTPASTSTSTDTPASGQDARTPRHTPPTILVVDDSPIILRMFQRFLKDTDATVLLAEDGDKGLDLYRNKKIDLIFMDEIMGTSGHEAIASIRQLESQNNARSVPILGITTDDSMETKTLMLNSGATDVIYKPIYQETIKSIIDKYIPHT